MNLIHGHRDVRKQKPLHHLYHKDGIWHIVETSYKPHAHFISFKGENPTYVILLDRNCKCWLHLDINRPISVKLSLMIEIV